jgi:phospholipase A1
MKKYVILPIVFSVYLFAEGASIYDVPKELDETKSQINIKNIKNDKSKENMQKWLSADFGLRPYKTNYILPFAIANKEYVSHKPAVSYDRKEAELQVSLKLKVSDNLFGLHEKYYLSYTHKAFWQIYINSSPFRESLYNPEAFIIFPISDKRSGLNMRSLKIAYAHKSNGQPNTEKIPGFEPLGYNLSKSINYFYGTLRLQYDTLITDLTLLAPFPGSSNLSDNPDIMNYLGYTKAKFSYFYNEHMFTMMVRGNLKSLKGAVEATYSYPLPHDTYLYVKFFSGYVESLVDYNRNVTKFSIGFSFSR